MRVLVSFVLLVSMATAAAAARFETNHALGKPTTQTSVVWGGDPSRAVDGNTDGNYANNSVTHTQVEFEPYWQVDLGGKYMIDRLEIFNRADCCNDRLRNVLVFFSEEPMTSRSIFDTIQQAGVTTRSALGQLDAEHKLEPHVRARYIRIQLYDVGLLSLAEVRAIESVEIDGPAPIAAATSWVPTGVYTSGSAFALAEIDAALSSFHRGFDGTLHAATDVAADRRVLGSPQIADAAPAVAVDKGSNTVFVAVRGADGGLYVATGSSPSKDAPRVWNWTLIATTTGAPAIIAAGDKVVVSWLEGAHIRSTWRKIVNGWWAPPTIHIDATTPPSLARDESGAVGIAFLRWDGSINFVKGRPTGLSIAWSGVQVIPGRSYGARVGLTAWGDLFVVSALGGDARPYVAIQQVQNESLVWHGFEPAWGVNDVRLSEVPTVAMFQGVMFVLARDFGNSLRYWVRNPNVRSYRYGAGDMWLGGRVVGGWGIGATPPALAAVGSSKVWGVWGSPSEFYVATRGIGDRQIYAINFARFVSLDVFSSFGISLRPTDDVPELDVRTVRNLFEHMVAFLSLPGSGAWAANARNPECGASQVRILLDPAAVGQTRPALCPPEMTLNASFQPLDTMFHEWMHMDHARRSLANRPGYGTTFDNPMPKLCATDADCGGDTCRLADEEFGAFDPRDSAAIRRWIGSRVCITSDGRPQGHVDFYALGNSEHDFIETAMLYRWRGRQLKAMALADLVRGNPRLYHMYGWLYVNYFDIVEYSGDGSENVAKADRNAGWWGMPSN